MATQYIAKNGIGIVLKVGTCAFYATSFSYNEDFAVADFNAIGEVQAVEQQTVGYKCTVSINFVVTNTDRDLLTEYGKKTVDGKVDTSRSNVLKTAVRYDVMDKQTFNAYLRNGARDIDINVYQLVSDKTQEEFATGDITPDWERENLIFQLRKCLLTSKSTQINANQLVTGSANLVSLFPPLNPLNAKR